MSQSWLDVLRVLLTTALSAVAAVFVVTGARSMIRRLGRRSTFLTELTNRGHRPAQAFAGSLATRLTLEAATNAASWRSPVLHTFDLVTIAATGWLIGALLMVVEDTTLTRVRTDMRDNRHARRLHTQITVIRRVTVAVIALITLGGMLMTFPAARAAGASLLASAAVIGAVAALAAQSLLGNVLAGVQIAFSDAIRIDDVVVVDKQWGRIEDITLVYVVVHVWDDRRLILPTSYFMSNPFENWTRKESALLGTVEMDLDWMVPVARMREQLRHILQQSDLWDGRVCVLQVTDAINTIVRVRALVSAPDAPTLWDLRCVVREELITWLQRNCPTAMPRLRVESAQPGTPAPAPTDSRPTDLERDRHARLFGESLDGNAREQQFSGPPQEEQRTEAVQSV